MSLYTDLRTLRSLPPSFKPAHLITKVYELEGVVSQEFLFARKEDALYLRLRR